MTRTLGLALFALCAAAGCTTVRSPECSALTRDGEAVLSVAALVHEVDAADLPPDTPEAFRESAGSGESIWSYTNAPRRRRGSVSHGGYVALAGCEVVAQTVVTLGGGATETRSPAR